MAPKTSVRIASYMTDGQLDEKAQLFRPGAQKS